MNANNTNNTNNIPAHEAVNNLAKLLHKKSQHGDDFTVTDDEFATNCGTHSIKWLINNGNFHGKSVGQLLKALGDKFSTNTLQVVDMHKRHFAVGMTKEQLNELNPLGQDSQRLANTLVDLAEQNRYNSFGLNFKRLEKDYREQVRDDFKALIEAATPIANNKLLALGDDMFIQYKNLDKLVFTCFGNVNCAMSDMADMIVNYILEAIQMQRNSVSIPFEDIDNNTRGHHWKWLMSEKAKYQGKYEGKKSLEDLINELLAQHGKKATVDTSFEHELVFNISPADEKKTAPAQVRILTKPKQEPVLKQSWGDLPTDAFPVLPGAKPVTQKAVEKPKPTHIAPMAKPTETTTTNIEEAVLAISNSTLLSAEAKARAITRILA